MWDSDFIGVYPRSIITSTWTIGSNTYMILNFNNSTSVYCTSVEMKDNFILVIEEFKKIFGLHCLQYSTIQIDNTLYLIYKEELDEHGNYITNTLLSEIKLGHFLLTDDTFCDNVRKVFLFRHILGLSGTMEKNINIHRYYDRETGNLTFIPMSTKDYQIDKKIINNDKSTSIAKVLFLKWFSEKINMRSILMSMLNIQNDAQIPEGIHYTRENISKAIMNLAPEYLWYQNIVVDRIIELLT